MKTTVKCVVVLMLMSFMSFGAIDDKELTIDGTVKSAKIKKGEQVYVLVVNKKSKLLLPASDAINYADFKDKKVTVSAMGHKTVRGAKAVIVLSEVKDIKEQKKEE